MNIEKEFDLSPQPPYPIVEGCGIHLHFNNPEDTKWQQVLIPPEQGLFWRIACLHKLPHEWAKPDIESLAYAGYSNQDVELKPYIFEPFEGLWWVGQCEKCNKVYWGFTER